MKNDRAKGNRSSSTSFSWTHRIKKLSNILLISFLAFCSLDLGGSYAAQAGELADRVQAFPRWQSKPIVQLSQSDLFYPTWMAGNWRVESTLVDLVAPLAPEIITPGFDSNRNYLNQPISFAVRFVEQPITFDKRSILSLRSVKVGMKPLPIIADRAFNGANIARAYLGDQAIVAIKMDPSEPNRQITVLRGDRQLISTITGRAMETPAPEQFITTEIFQQVFRGSSQPYLNQVETTTAYQWLGADQPEIALDKLQLPAIAPSTVSSLSVSSLHPLIEADQMTAIYLSPHDANYFKAQETPVALYRYRLAFFPLEQPRS